MDSPPSPQGQSIVPEEAILRGQAIELFARLEAGLNSVISGYYVRRQPLSTYFWMDVLSSDGFSYSLRRGIFESIVQRHELYDAKRMQHLHTVGRWRNFLAHVAGVETHEYGPGDELLKVGYRDSRRPNKILTVAEAFAEFEPAWVEANEYVLFVLRKIHPLNQFQVPGHIVEDPVPSAQTFDEWVKRPSGSPE